MSNPVRPGAHDTNRIRIGSVADNRARCDRISLYLGPPCDIAEINGRLGDVPYVVARPPMPPEVGAVIVDNDVIMSGPQDTAFEKRSAGIEIGGVSRRNLVLNNRIQGRSGAAISVIARNGSSPEDTTLIANHFEEFLPQFPAIFVDAGVANTLILERTDRIEDHGL